MKQQWRKFDGEPLTQSLYEEVRKAIELETANGNKLKVCIGTDSQVKGHCTEYATAVVFVREKRGGFMFISHHSSVIKMSIRERMITEVSQSIDTAYQLCNLLDKYHVELEVHADINTSPHFKSNTALSEAMGYILSMGFVFKAKPQAFASSYCANKMVQ